MEQIKECQKSLVKVSIDQMPQVYQQRQNTEILGKIIGNHVCYLCSCFAHPYPMMCRHCNQVYCLQCLRDMLTTNIERCHACNRDTRSKQFIRISDKHSVAHYTRLIITCVN